MPREKADDGSVDMRKGTGKPRATRKKTKAEVALENSLFGSSASRSLISSSSSSSTRSSAAAAIASAFTDDVVSSLAASISGTGGRPERAVEEEDERPLFSLDSEKRDAVDGGKKGKTELRQAVSHNDDEERAEYSEGEDNSQLKPAWRDEDDDNIEVDVGAVPMLRKLRKDVGEDTKLGADELRKRLKERHAKTASSTGASLPWSARGKRKLEKQRRKRKRKDDEAKRADDVVYDDDEDDDDDEEENDDDDNDGDEKDEKGEGDKHDTNEDDMIQDDDETEDKIVATTASVFARPSKRVAGRNGNAEVRRPLPSGAIDILRLRDANAEAISKSVVQCLGFNPNPKLSGNLMFTAGLDCTLRLFDVDGQRNGQFGLFRLGLYLFISLSLCLFVSLSLCLLCSCLTHPH